MSALTELEIFDCIATNVGEAASNCDRLATQTAKGPTYYKLRQNLRLIEGACRQMGFYRDDMRYMLLGMQAAEAQKRIGDWVRVFGGRELFLKFSAALRKIGTDIERLRHARTGRRGPILMPAQPVHRDTRPVYVEPKAKPALIVAA